MKGIYNVGEIIKTENQKKKHVCQMTKEEIEYLSKRLKKLDLSRISISKHLKTKDVDFQLSDIVKTLKNRNLKDLIIEYNETPQGKYVDNRVVIRSNEVKNVTFYTKNKKAFTVPANMCFVISLKSCRVVTVYWNKANDDHRTMLWDRYDKSLQIVK